MTVPKWIFLANYDAIYTTLCPASAPSATNNTQKKMKYLRDYLLHRSSSER